MSRNFDIDFGDWVTADGFDYADYVPAARSGQRYLIELADVCRNAGLTVIEVDGWQQRARGSGGYDGTYPWVVMLHHTASNTTPENDVGYICYGCPDAPVANLYLARDGTVWVCAAGATNTNGTGGPMMMSKGVIPEDDCNRAAVSIEMANNGTGQPWPQVQIDAMFRLTLALTAHLGLRPDDCAGHYDWTPGRKIDPARADAVEGPWQPNGINTSGTWSITDVRDEMWLRSEWLPPEGDDEMSAATLWRPQGYINTFLIGAGSTMHLSPAVFDSLSARGVPYVVEAHDQMLQTCLFQTGLTMADMVPGG